jgi:Secretion system C-terminal sorting domain
MNFIILLFYLANSFGLSQNPIFPNPANWDTTRIYSAGSGTLQKVAVGNQLKGITDDTFRIATGQSPLTRNALILTDTSSLPPMKWRADIPFTGAGTNGIISVAIGDVDEDGVNEIIFGQAGGNLKQVKWSGTTWEVTQIDSQGGQVYDIAIGDPDNNGVTDIIFARYNWLFRSYWNGGSWQTSQIWMGDGNRCYGVAVGDFDTLYSGNEIVATTYNGRVLRIKWNASIWDTLTMCYISQSSFYDPAIGDFDSLHVGNEIVFGNATSTPTYGSVIELYGSGTNWSTRQIYTPSSGEAYQNLAIGDVLDEHTGLEVVSLGGSSQIYVRAIYGSGSNWSNQIVTSFPQVSAYGIAIGDINKYRTLNQEIVFARNTALYEAEQRAPPGPAIINISHYPIVPLFNEAVTVRAKILDSLTITTDSLYYALNSPTGWQGIGHFNLDSFYYYTIPAQDTGTMVYYFIKAKNNLNGVTQSSIFSYQVAYEHNIHQIQYTLDPSGTSPDSGKWIHTQGIVTGRFGRFFNIEETPGGAWHGIHIRRPQLSDTFPNLTIGDSVTVLGQVIEYYNQTVLNVFYDSGGKVDKISSSYPLPCTTIAMIHQVAESLEGSLVKIDTVCFKVSGYFQPDSLYWIYNFAETESLICFIRPETDIAGESIPQGYLLLTGNLSQYLTNYQIVPRALADCKFLPVDFGVTQILVPGDTVNYGDSIVPKIIIQNYQLTPVVNLSVWLKIDNTYNNQYFFSKLSPQPIDTIEFAPWFAGSGQHRITAYTQLENDINPHNDTLFDSVYVIPPYEPPDIGVSRISLPHDTVLANESIVARVIINNYSSTAAVNFYTIFKIGNIFTDSVFVPNLGPLMLMILDFQPWLSIPGNYQVISYTKNSADTNPSNDTAYGSLTVISTIAYWQQKKDMPFGAGKKVKQGGALVCGERDTVYAFKGNNTREFYAYNTSADSWVKKESLPSLINMNKRVKKGGSLTYDRWNRQIYALKGNNTREFWRYDIIADSWSYIGEVPSADGKKVKGGAALSFVKKGSNYFVYFMKGSKSSEFYAYNVLADTWLKGLKAIPRLPSDKPMKDGSCMTLGIDFIYCLKGGYNDFYAYDPDVDSWYIKKSLPLYSASRKKKKVKDGAGLCYDDTRNLIYALKGGNTQEFWAYHPDLDTWTELDTIPKGLSNKRVKSGSSLTFASGAAYALKGNNTRELWCYTPATFDQMKTPTPNAQATMTNALTNRFDVLVKNPSHGFIQIKYNTISQSPLSLKIFDITGALVKSEIHNTLQPGIITLDIRGMASGVYILRIDLDKTSIIRKIVIEK